jgi:hypothetical protein
MGKVSREGSSRMFSIASTISVLSTTRLYKIHFNNIFHTSPAKCVSARDSVFKTFVFPSGISYCCHLTSPNSSSARWKVQAAKPTIVYFFSVSCYLLPLRSTYSYNILLCISSSNTLTSASSLPSACITHHYIIYIHMGLYSFLHLSQETKQSCETYVAVIPDACVAGILLWGRRIACHRSICFAILLFTVIINKDTAVTGRHRICSATELRT